MGTFFGAALGAAAGLGLNHLANQAEIKQALDPKHFQPVGPPLVVEQQVNGERVCSIGIPPGWREMTREEKLQISGAARARVDLGVCTTEPDPTLGCSATSFAVLDQGPNSAPGNAHLMFAALDEMVRARVQAVPGFSPYGAPWRIALDGERAFVHHLIGSAPGAGFGVDHPVSMMQGEAFVVHGTTMFAGMFASPTDTYESYLPHFWTMLGTWRWRQPTH